ncbi:DMT family transporter [Legionella cardiaca]|uniref:EamA family transporter n=1 Tax=Legionella cardiaca TaxID=1071983 RepID=A0ABY8AV69_9GAMM|nr:EamA family transporter [Legionella cardiaca]WED43644.1 EamA family transporter [Legionella cardiaca]
MRISYNSDLIGGITKRRIVDSIKVNCMLAFTLLFWASAFVGIRVGLMAYSPGSLALLRFLVASLCMAIIYWQLPNKKRIPWNKRWQLLLIGIAGIGIYNISLNYGEMSVSAGVASFVIGLMPVITIILSVLFLQERPGRLVWLGILISFIGLVFLLWAENTQTTFDGGVLIILIASLMGGIYTISQKRYLRDFHPIAITAWVIWGGTLLLLIFTPQLSREIKMASFKATFAAVYMGIFPAALAYVGWCYVLNHMPASKASMYLYALPILSTLMGAILLHETLTGLSLVGGLLALSGAIIAGRSSSNLKRLK